MKTKDIFNNVNIWLQFAEVKNGALLTFNAAIIFATLNLYESFYKLHYFRYIVFLFLTLILISLIINLLSFLPSNKTGSRKNDNVIFWASISNFDSIESYSSELNKEQKSDEIDKHIEDEIYINSKITTAKYKKFKWALYFNISGIIVVLFYAIVLFSIKFF